MKARNTLIAVLAALVFGVPSLVQAQGLHQMRGHGMRGGAGMLGPGPRVMEKLGVTEEQRSQIQAIVSQERPAIQALREQLAEGRLQFVQAQVPGEFDEAAVRAHAEAQAKLRVELAVVSMRVKAGVYSVLTPEQQAELKELRELFGDRRGRCSGRRGV